MSTSASLEPRSDRRHLRRAQTIEQIVDVAVEVMAEQGVGGLSLGEVARRIGVRPPSLYVYFDSKHAVYDAVFARGWREIAQRMAEMGEPPEAGDLDEYFLSTAEEFVRWSVEHPVHSQLMAWRPVPGYEPSAEAYEPAQQLLAASTARFTQLQALGLLDPEADPAELLRAWTVVLSGVMTQQLANAPDESFETGTFTTLLPQLVQMFLTHHAPDPPINGRTSHAPRRRSR